MNIKTLVLSLSIILTSYAASAQVVDTVYYDKQAKETTDKNLADHYVVLTKNGKQEHAKAYTMSGTLREEWQYKAGNQYNYYNKLYYRYNNNKKYEGNYVDGKRQGAWTGYYEDGSIRIRKTYDKGLLVDTLTEYYPSSAIKRQAIFNSHLISQDHYYKEDGEETTNNVRVFSYVEQMPKADYDMMQCIKDNIVYPNTKAEGKVLVRFVVDEEGDIINIESLSKEADTLLVAESIRVVSTMTHWNCGQQNGKDVKVFYTLPVLFKRDSNK